MLSFHENREKFCFKYIQSSCVFIDDKQHITFLSWRRAAYHIFQLVSIIFEFCVKVDFREIVNRDKTINHFNNFEAFLVTVRVIFLPLEFVTINRFVINIVISSSFHTLLSHPKHIFQQYNSFFIRIFFYPFYLVKHEYSYFRLNKKKLSLFKICVCVCVWYFVYNDAKSNKDSDKKYDVMRFILKINKLNLNTTLNFGELINVNVNKDQEYCTFSSKYWSKFFFNSEEKKVCEMTKVWNEGFELIFIIFHSGEWQQHILQAAAVAATDFFIQSLRIQLDVLKTSFSLFFSLKMFYAKNFTVGVFVATVHTCANILFSLVYFSNSISSMKFVRNSIFFY